MTDNEGKSAFEYIDGEYQRAPTVDTPAEIETKEVKAYKKRITLSCFNGKTWEAEFDGLITPRDIKKLQRALIVEYAKASRRRSTVRILQRQAFRQQELANVSKNEKDSSNDSTTNG